MAEIKTAIIPTAGLATRFLPLSKVVPKELWPLVEAPVIQYIVAEAKNAGIRNIIFVVKPKNKILLDYFKPSLAIEKTLKERKKTVILSELKKMEDYFSDINFSFVSQKQPLGDGHAVLQAAKIAQNEPAALLFADDIVDSKTPCVLQLSNVFKTCQKPILSLCPVPKEKLQLYGIASVEKIASKLHKIKKIIEKPAPGMAPSDLAIVGKYILTPEVFGYLKKAKPSPKGEIILAETLEEMLKDGKVIYGYEFEGRWIECGNKLDWLKSNIYFSLRHPQYGPEIKKFLKELRI